METRVNASVNMWIGVIAEGGTHLCRAKALRGVCVWCVSLGHIRESGGPGVVPRGRHESAGARLPRMDKVTRLAWTALP